MKTHYWLRRSAALVCLAATLPFNCGRAQDQPKASETTPAAQPGAKGRSASPYVLEIAGGGFVSHGIVTGATLATVADALRDIWPEANIVLAPEVANLQVADLKLRSPRDLGEALEALRVATGYRFEWRKGMPGAGGMTDPATGLPTALPKQPARESSLYVLDLGIDAQGHPLERARRMVEVFNLGGYLDHLQAHDPKEVDQTLVEIDGTVIETQGGLRGGNVPENDRPHFQFHRSTRLLVVTGPPDAIEVARKVVGALTGQPIAGDRVPFGAVPDANPRAAQAAFASRYGVRLPEPAAPPAPLNPPAAPAALPPR